MFKKIAIIGILLLLSTSTGFAVASNEIPGLYLTLVDKLDDNPIQFQLVRCERTVQGILYIDDKYTDVDGLVWFGASAEEAYYHLRTYYQNWTYSITVWKPWGQIGRTWKLGPTPADPGPHQE